MAGYSNCDLLILPEEGPWVRGTDVREEPENLVGCSLLRWQQCPGPKALPGFLHQLLGIQLLHLKTQALSTKETGKEHWPGSLLSALQRHSRENTEQASEEEDKASGPPRILQKDPPLALPPSAHQAS